MASKLFRRTEAGEHHQLWRPHSAGTQNHPVRAQPRENTVPSDGHAARASTLDVHLQGSRSPEHLEIGASHHRNQVCQCGIHSSAIDRVARNRTYAPARAGVVLVRVVLEAGRERRTDEALCQPRPRCSRCARDRHGTGCAVDVATEIDIALECAKVRKDIAERPGRRPGVEIGGACADEVGPVDRAGAAHDAPPRDRAHRSGRQFRGVGIHPLTARADRQHARVHHLGWKLRRRPKTWTRFDDGDRAVRIFTEPCRHHRSTGPTPHDDHIRVAHIRVA